MIVVSSHSNDYLIYPLGALVGYSNKISQFLYGYQSQWELITFCHILSWVKKMRGKGELVFKLALCPMWVLNSCPWDQESHLLPTDPARHPRRKGDFFYKGLNEGLLTICWLILNAGSKTNIQILRQYRNLCFNDRQ